MDLNSIIEVGKIVAPAIAAYYGIKYDLAATHAIARDAKNIALKADRKINDHVNDHAKGHYE